MTVVTLESLLASGVVASGVSGVFDANAAPYSCVSDTPGHDNAAGITAAIADAVAWAAAHDGIGVVEFDAGEYWINGALQTSVGNAYAQIPLPAVSATASKVLLILRPRIAAGAQTYGSGSQTSAQKGLVIFHSGLTGQVYNVTNGAPSILGGPQYVRTADFSNILLHLQGIGFRTAPNPSLVGVDAGRLQQVIFENCRWDTTEWPTSTQPTHVTGLASIVPGVNNNATADYRGINFCAGWYAGPAIGEHTQADKLISYMCYVGTNVGASFYHAAQVNHLSTEWCPYGVASVDPASGIISLGGLAYATINVDLWDIEDAAAGWYVPVAHVNDPGNRLFGRWRYLRVLAGTGTQSGALTKSGAVNLSLDDLTTFGAAPRLIGAKAYATATQSIPNAALTPINFDSEEFDSDAIHEGATHPSYFIVPRAGKYLLQGGTALAAQTPTFEAIFYKNGTTVLRGVTSGPANIGVSPMFTISAIAAMAAGDRVELCAFQSSGGPLVIGHASGLDAQSWASVTFLGT